MQPKRERERRGGGGVEGRMRYRNSVCYVQHVLFLTYTSEIYGLVVVEIIILLNAT